MEICQADYPLIGSIDFALCLEYLALPDRKLLVIKWMQPQQAQDLATVAFVITIWR